ncbi:Uncharacterized protein FKW44_012317, partial [Caligus rogercresseyi]
MEEVHHRQELGSLGGDIGNEARVACNTVGDGHDDSVSTEDLVLTKDGSVLITLFLSREVVSGLGIQDGVV